MNKLYAILLASLLGLFLLFSGCVSNKETIKIGAIYPLTGNAAFYGELGLNSAKIAVDEINANGGINDKNLELVVEDHQCDPKTGLQAFEQMYSTQNINLFTSLACTSVSVAIANNLEKQNSLLTATLVTGTNLSGISPNYFRNWSVGARQAKVFADEIKKKQIKTVGTIYEELDYPKGLIIDTKKQSDQSVKFIEESFPPNAIDVKSQITKLMSEDLDVVFIAAQGVTTGAVVLKQMEDLNFRPKVIFISDSILKSNLVKDFNNLLDGAYGADFVFKVNSNQDAFYKKYLDTYGKECSQQSICTINYDTIYIYANAIKNVGTDTKKVREYLKNNSYRGITGDIAFDEKNDRANADYSLFVVKNGNIELVN